MPFASVTAKSTVIVCPAWAQVKLLGVTAEVTAPQLSVAEMVTIDGVTVAGLPVVGLTWMAWQETTGAILS